MSKIAQYDYDEDDIIISILRNINIIKARD